MNSCNLVTILSILLLVMFVWMMFQRSKEDYIKTSSHTFKPLHQSYPYTSTGTTPRGMYNRMNYVSPGFYSGSGLKRQLRPGVYHKHHHPRNQWLLHNGKYHSISNLGDLYHNAANYDYIRRYSCCDQ